MPSPAAAPRATAWASSVPGNMRRRQPLFLVCSASFAGEANWNYFVAPFNFARADFTSRSEQAKREP
jgi:hypothetical protein